MPPSIQRKFLLHQFSQLKASHPWRHFRYFFSFKLAFTAHFNIDEPRLKSAPRIGIQCLNFLSINNLVCKLSWQNCWCGCHRREQWIETQSGTFSHAALSVWMKKKTPVNWLSFLGLWRRRSVGRRDAR